MATNYDITAIQGSSLDVRFTALDSSNVVIDLTPYTTSGFVRLGYGETGILINLAPIIHNSFVSGFIDVAVPTSGLVNLPITQGVYDIKIYHTGTNNSTEIARGYFNVNPAATI